MILNVSSSFIKRVLPICIVCFIGTVFNAKALITRSRANAEKTAAVNAERQKSQKQINSITKERDDIKKAKEEEVKKLNDTIANLQKDIVQKEKEKTDLNEKVKAAEISRKDYETKAAKEKTDMQTEFATEKKRLNQLIAQKTTQLNEKISELKNAVETSRNLSKSFYNTEASHLIDKEMLRNEINGLKTELKSLLNRAKQFETEAKNSEKTLLTKTEIETKNLNNIITKNQETEMRMLAEIERLKSKLNDYIQKQREIINEGKLLEEKLNTKITALVDKIKQYSSILEATRETELRNLSVVSNLRTRVNDAITINDKLVAEGKTISENNNAVREENERIRKQFESAWQKEKYFSAREVAKIFGNPDAQHANPTSGQPKSFPQNPIDKTNANGTMQTYETSKQTGERTSENGRAYNPLATSTNVQSPQNSYMQQPNNAQTINSLQITLQQPRQTKQDELVDFAVEAILKSILNMTNNDVEKTNAAMNLIGAGVELPETLNAIVGVVREQYNPEILTKAVEEINRRQQQRNIFVNESLNHLYGKNGEKLIYWNK
ncbi:MAG: hypothetical protein LBM19_00440 [Holosporales bacterium]|jgi:hypothetical protein|nr:hypothetical protein [Holosporales bacterium]